MRAPPDLPASLRRRGRERRAGGSPCKVATIAGAWVNNPYTMPFVFYGCFRFGEWILGMRTPSPSFESYTLQNLLKAAVPYAAPLFLGTTVVGLAAAAVAYGIVYRIAVRVKYARRKGTQ